MLLRKWSGIEIQVTEKDTLIHNIYDVMKDFKTLSANKTKLDRENTTSKVLGVDARNKWTDLLEESSTVTYNSIHSINHDHGLLVTPLTDEVLLVDEKFQVDIAEKEIKDMAQEPSAVSLPPAGTTPKAPKKPCQTLVQSVATPSASNSSKILGSVRSRKRKMNTQRQGLAYLEQYDKAQAEVKRQEVELEERKLILEERKIQLMEQQHRLAEFQIKKQLELEEKTINLEIQSRDSLMTIAERQDKLLNLLINKLT